MSLGSSRTLPHLPSTRVIALAAAGFLAGTAGLAATGGPSSLAHADSVTAAQDNFARQDVNSWGDAVVGGKYTVSSASAFSVDGTSGRILHATAGKRLYATLPSTDLRDGLLTATFTADKAPVGWGQTFSLVQRRLTDGEDYEARLRVAVGGSAFLAFVRRDSTGQEHAVGTETPIVLSSTQTAALAAGGAGMQLAFEAVGTSPTTLRARAWPAGTTQPSTWSAQATDTTRALTGYGAAGISTMLSSSTNNLPVTLSAAALQLTDETVASAISVTAAPLPRYGAVPLGAARYPVPSNARYVSPQGDDAGAGTASDPWLTLGHAVASSPTGSTIVMRGGTYRESVAVYAKQLTIENYPGEKVYLSGSDPVTNWVADGSAFRSDNWTAHFVQGGRPDLTDSAHPLAAYPDQLFVDGRSQTQVASRSAVVAGTFYVDYANKALYMGTNPAGHQVEGSTRNRGLYLNQAHGSIVRGIAVVHYANHPNDMGALFDDGDNTILENDVFSQNASIGVSVMGHNVQVLHDTANDNGQIGLHADHADGLQVRGNLLQHNNTEYFAIEGAEGNMKITATNGVVVADNLSRYSVGRGMWFDVNSLNITAVRNVIANNLDRGMQFEISGTGVIASNLIVNNASDGLSVIDGTNVDVYNNSFWHNTRAVFVVDDNRTQNNATFPQAVHNVALRNNVASGSRSGTMQIVAVEDTTRTRSASSMNVTVDADAYAQVGTDSAAYWFGWANYPSAYMVFRDFANFQRTTGQETNGLGVAASVEPFFNAPASGDFSIQAGSLSQVNQAPLPTRVAAALGMASGATLPPGSQVLDTNAQ